MRVFCLISCALVVMFAFEAKSQEEDVEQRFRGATKDMRELQILQELVISRGRGCLIELEVYGSRGISKSDCSQFSAIMADYGPKYSAYLQSYRDIPALAMTKLKEYQSQGMKTIDEIPEPYQSYLSAIDNDKTNRATDTIDRVTTALKYLR